MRVDRVDWIAGPFGVYSRGASKVDRKDVGEGWVEVDMSGASLFNGVSIRFRMHGQPDGSLVAELLDQDMSTDMISPVPSDAVRACTGASGEIAVASANLAGPEPVRCRFDIVGSWHESSDVRTEFTSDYELRLSGEIDLPPPR